MPNQKSAIQNMWDQFYKGVFAYYDEDPSTTRKGITLSILTFTFTLLSLVSLIIFPLFGFNSIATGFTGIISVVSLGFVYILVRLGYLNWAGVLTVVVIGVLSTNPVGDMNSLREQALGIPVLILTIALSALLIGPRAMFITAFITGLAASWSLIFTETPQFTEAIFVVIVFLLIALVIYFLLQEVRIALAKTEIYTMELEQAKGNLEAQIVARTEALQTSFDLTSQVSAIITNNNNLQALLKQTIELIQQTFHFYHVHIYTYDRANSQLLMTSGSGEVGRILKKEKHHIDLGKGIVGSVALNQENLVINNVDEFPNFIRNRLLPDTQSEMAIPMKRGGEVLGVLDIQNNVLNSFSELDAELMQALANQLAIAMHGLLLVAETEDALATVEALNKQLVEQRWEQALQQTQVTGYKYTPDEVSPTETAWIPSMSLALNNEVTSEDDEVVHLQDDAEQIESVAIPIKLRGQTIGILGLERNQNQSWTKNELLVIQTIGEQIGLALEGARLFETTGRAAWRDRVVSESTAKLWASGELEEVMRIAVQQLGDTLSASEVVIRLGTDTQLTRSH